MLLSCRFLEKCASNKYAFYLQFTFLFFDGFMNLFGSVDPFVHISQSDDGDRLCSVCELSWLIHRRTKVFMMTTSAMNEYFVAIRNDIYPCISQDTSK
jgi:hypothetical protein